MELSYIVNTNKKPVAVRNTYELTNLAPYGNFENADGWSSISGNVSASNNTLIVTDNGTDKSLSPYKTTDILMTSLYGKKVAVRVKMKPVGNVKPANIRIRLRGSGAGTSNYIYAKSDPDTGVTYTMIAIADMSSVYGTAYLRVYLEAVYRSTDNISNCSLECTELMMFNLTDSFGAGNEPGEENLNFIIDNCVSSAWFAGSVETDISVRSQQIDDLANRMNDVQEKLVNDVENPVFVRNCYNMKNLMPSGNFESATGWLSSAGVVSASNNKLITTYDGTNKNFIPYTVLDIPMSSLYGKRIAVRVKMKPVGDVSPATMKVEIQGATAGSQKYTYTKANPVQNTVYVMTAIADMSSVYGSGNLRINLKAEYRSSADVSECSLECTEMMVINLTDGFGAGNEPNEDFLNYIVDSCLPSPWFAALVEFDISATRQQVDNLIEQMNDVEEKLEIISSAIPNKYEIVNIPNRLIMTCWRNVILAYDATKFEISFDTGETWQDCVGVPAQTSQWPIAIIFRSGKVVIFEIDAYYYSDDGINYTEVLYSEVGIQNAPYYTGVSLLPYSYGDTAIFGEYTPAWTGHCRLWKTTDGGHTWNAIFDATKEIRHFHTIKPLRHATYGGVLATSGDTDAQVQWWFSPDFGTTWNSLVDGTSNDVLNPQDYRSLGQVFDEDGNVYWSVDNDQNETTAVYKAHITNPLERTKILDVCGVGYGLKNAGGILVFTAISPLSGAQPVSASYIYCSMDSGKTWDIVLKDIGQNDSYDLPRTIGPDALGRFYFPHGKMKLGNYSQGTYRLDIHDNSWKHN